jgi:hypothetical protein
MSMSEVYKHPENVLLCDVVGKQRSGKITPGESEAHSVRIDRSLFPPNMHCPIGCIFEGSRPENSGELLHGSHALSLLGSPTCIQGAAMGIATAELQIANMLASHDNHTAS